MIKGEQGNVIWNPQQYAFIKEGEKSPDTVNPSLWRQSQLINISGLFEVTDGVYQIRNLDLSNMTIIEGKEGITVVDPLVSAETAKAGMDLYFKTVAISLLSPSFILIAMLTTMAVCVALSMKRT